ncbi:MAG: hypothetical protein P8X81_04065 [Woeseiaceae bacterium]|jgi:hypothetical protein
MQNAATNRQDQEVLELLKDYPMPEADAGFYDQALVRATHEGSRRQRNKWMMTGFGAAIAATIAAWLIGGMLLNDPQLPAPEAAIPGVTIALAEPRTVNLVFASATALDSATLTVSLPDGIELDGFPGQREITWQTSLQEGKNLLPLTLVALTPAGGELLAHLEHEDRDRTFRLRVDVT